MTTAPTLPLTLDAILDSSRAKVRKGRKVPQGMFIAIRISISLLIATAACGFPRPPHLFDDGGSDGDAPKRTYQLLALAPSTAATGDTITLEGTFGDAATVHFPGNVSQPATVLGPHRATVVVPATATTGELTIETGGAMLGPLPFRRTSFALGLQTFRNSYEQVDVARQMPSLTTARSGHSTAITRSSIYVIGGVAAAGYLSSIEGATLNIDGTVGALTSVTGVSLTTARSGHTATVIGTSLYVIGGDSDRGALSSVERAAINSDGTLGPFVIEPVRLVTARKYAASSIVGNFLYVVGGADGGALNTVERAEISTDGTLGAFSIVSDVTLATGRSGHACTAIGRFLYVLGGTTNGRVTGTVERALIDGSGKIGPFEDFSIAFVTARNNHTSVVFGMSLYVLGGLGEADNLGTVEKADIAPDGSLGPFTILPSATLSTPRSGHTASVINNYLYLIGGSNNGYLRGIERATINVSGRIGTFSATANSTLPTPRRRATIAVAGAYIYIIGGISGDDFAQPLDTIERATVNPDGSIGPFSTMRDIKLAEARSNHCSAVLGRYVYVLGGNMRGGSGLDGGAPIVTIERATIDPYGQLGTFVTVPATALHTYRSSSACLTSGEFIYAFGGVTTGAAFTNAVERASIGRDGNLDNFDRADDALLRVGRGLSSTAMFGNMMYIFGGDSMANNGLSSAEQAFVRDDGFINSFSISTDIALASIRSSHSAAVIGSHLYVLGGTSGSTPTTTVESASFGSISPTESFAITPGVGLTAARADHHSLVIGNYIYNIGGSMASIEQAPLL